MNWKIAAACLSSLCLGLGVGVLLPFGNGGSGSGGGPIEPGASVSGLSPLLRPASGGDSNPGGGKLVRSGRRSRERVSQSLGDREGDGGVMVSAAILSELELPGSVSSLDQDLVDGEGRRGNPAAAGDLRLGQAGFLKCFAEGFGEKIEQRDELWFLFHDGGSVIVGNLNIGGVAVFPAKDDAPSLVDAGAPESLEIAGERFEAVGRWLAELVD